MLEAVDPLEVPLEEGRLVLIELADGREHRLLELPLLAGQLLLGAADRLRRPGGQGVAELGRGGRGMAAEDLRQRPGRPGRRGAVDDPERRGRARGRPDPDEEAVAADLQLVAVGQREGRGGRRPLVDEQVVADEVDEEGAGRRSHEQGVDPGDRPIVEPDGDGAGPADEGELRERPERVGVRVVADQLDDREPGPGGGQGVGPGAGRRPGDRRVGVDQLEAVAGDLEAAAGPEPAGMGPGGRLVEGGPASRGEVDGEEAAGVEVEVGVPEARLRRPDRQVGAGGPADHGVGAADGRDQRRAVGADQADPEPAVGPERRRRPSAIGERGDGRTSLGACAAAADRRDPPRADRGAGAARRTGRPASPKNGR